MTLAIHELEKSAGANNGAIEAFLGDHEFPIIEGRNVTFVWRGEADDVFLRHWIYGLPSSQAFERINGSDLWFLIFELPERSRVEYKLEVRSGQERRLVQDPLNPHLARDPYGANSVVHATDYVAPDWIHEDPEARPGTIERLRFKSEVYGDVRPISVYLPARYRATRRYSLLVVHDGEDYLRFTNLQTVLDNLIHRLEIPPLIVALTQSRNRLHEYADDADHATYLVDELVPQLESRYPIVPEPTSRGLMGASFGAIATLSAAWRRPGAFGKLMLQSGSFAFTDIGDHDRGPLFDPVVDFVNSFRETPGRPADQVYLTCGTYESLIYYNRSLLPVLQGSGMNVRYYESRDGHNWENWRDRLREGLSWLYPGPLWMVYE